VLLGIFGAGATYLASGSQGDTPSGAVPHEPSLLLQVGLTVVTITLVGLWLWYTKERHEYRQAVRCLLVRCEMALGFFEEGAYLTGDSLYRREELKFPTKGTYLAFAYGVSVMFAAAGFSMVLWSARVAKCWGG